MRVQFQYEVYKNNNNGYTVAKYKNIEDNKTVTCIGFNLPTVKIPYNFSVEEVTDKKYGKQYKVISFTEDISNTEEDIVEYLSSKLFSGIGKAIAKRIYDKFGDKTIDVIENYPEELLHVKGVSRKKYDKFIESYNENHKYRDIITFLMPFGFNANQAVKICDTLGSTTLCDKLYSNPYIICDVKGFTFEHAERFKEKFGISDTDFNRIKAAAYEAIKRNFLHGCVSATKEQLISGMGKLLKLNRADAGQIIWNNILKMIASEELKYRKQKEDGKILLYFYIPQILSEENTLSSLISRFIKTIPMPFNIESLIDEYSNIDLDESQRKAVKAAFSSNISITTGGAGTGKTTTIKTISNIYSKLFPKYDQIFLAPTGRAARRISQSTGKAAYTIHSYLNLVSLDDDTAYQGEEVVISDALVVIDEFSMVDMPIAVKLFQALYDNCTVVIVGDPEQLMSVGIGSVLNDLIKSEIIPTTALKIEHRQKEGSVLISNANKIRRGETDIEVGDDFEIIPINDTRCEEDVKTLEDALVDATIKEIKKYGIDNVVCLSPYKKYTAGVISLNKRLQEILNPINPEYLSMKGAGDTYFRPADVVMHLVNDYEQGVMNGDVGKVLYIEKEEDDELCMGVVYINEKGKEHIVEYRKGDMDNIQLAYACTVHKAQGCEYKSVVTCCCNFHYYAKRKNLLYTAITRAKERVVLFGNKDCISEAIKNDVVDSRNTMLAYNLKHSKDAAVQENTEDKWVEFPKEEESDDYKQLSLFSLM